MSDIPNYSDLRDLGLTPKEARTAYRYYKHTNANPSVPKAETPPSHGNIDRSMSFPYSPNFYLTTNRENIEKYFLGEKRAASIFDINADEGYFLSRSGGQNSFITNLEFSYGYETGDNDHALILTIKDSNGDFENQFLSNDYLAENFIKVLKSAEQSLNVSLSKDREDTKQIKESSLDKMRNNTMFSPEFQEAYQDYGAADLKQELSDEKDLRSLNRSRNLIESQSQPKLVLYFAFGTSEDTQYWAGPFRARLTKAELRISSEGLREIDLVFTAENSIVKSPYLGLKNSIEDYNTFYGSNDMDFSLVQSLVVTPDKENPTEEDYYKHIVEKIHEYVEKLIIGYMKQAFKTENIITILPDMKLVLDKAIEYGLPPFSKLAKPDLNILARYLNTLFRVHLVQDKSVEQLKSTPNSKDYIAENNKSIRVTLKFGHISAENDDPDRLFPNFYKPLAMFSDTTNRQSLFDRIGHEIASEYVEDELNKNKTEKSNNASYFVPGIARAVEAAVDTYDELVGSEPSDQKFIRELEDQRSEIINYNNKKYAAYSKRFTVKEEINLDIINFWAKRGLVESPDDPVYIFGNEDVVKDTLYGYSKGTITTNFENPNVDYGDLLDNYLISIPGRSSSKSLNNDYINNDYAYEFSKIIFRSLPTSRDIYGADKALLSLDLNNGEALNSAIKNKINLPIFLFNTQNSNILSLIFETNNQYIDLLLAQPMSSKAKLISETLDGYKNKAQDVLKSYFSSEQLKFILGLEQGKNQLLEDLESGKSGAELKAQVSARIIDLIKKDYNKIIEVVNRKFKPGVALIKGESNGFATEHDKTNTINNLIKRSIVRKFYSLSYDQKKDSLITDFNPNEIENTKINNVANTIVFYSIYTPSNIKVVSKGDDDVLSRKVSLNEALSNRIYNLNIRTLPMFHISSQYFIQSESIVLAKKVNGIQSPVGGSSDTSFEPFSGVYLLNGFRHIISNKDAYSEFKLQKI